MMCGRNIKSNKEVRRYFISCHAWIIAAMNFFKMGNLKNKETER
jgi:hypothetical protein